MTKLKYTFIALISMLCVLTLTSCMDLYDGDEVQTRFTVTFDANGGSREMKPQTFAYGEEKALSANVFTREDYAFIGWGITKDQKKKSYEDNEIISITSDLKLFALWESSTCVITFKANFEGNTQPDVTQKISKGVYTALRLNTFTRPDYRFIGWATDPQKTSVDALDGSTVKYPNDTILYAVWTAGFTVSYADGAEDEEIAVPSSETKLSNTTVKVSFDGIGERYGYTFIGWLNSSDGKTYKKGILEEFTMPSNDVTLTAQWQENAIQGGGITMVVKSETEAALGLKAYPSESEHKVTFICADGYTYKWLCNGDALDLGDGTSDLSTNTRSFIWDVTSKDAGIYCISILATNSETAKTYSATVYVTLTKSN